MGTNLSVANDRESSPDPWWQNSSTASANVNTSTILKSTDTSSEEQRINDEVAIAVAAVVASSSELPGAEKLIDDDNIDQEQNQSQEDGIIFETGLRHEENQKKLEVFKQELATKREARQKAIAALTDKLKQLQQQVKTEENGRINAESEVIRLRELLAEGGLKEELENEKSKVKNLEIELENERKLRIEFEKEKEEVQEKEQQIRALREVASIGKEMLRIRELQVNELKKKLCETQYPEDLREEYEAQIQNVRRLKTLYEERAEAVRIEHQREIEREVARIQVLETKISELERERKEGEVMREHLKDRVLKLDQELEERNDSAMVLQEQLDASVIECRDLASQMSLINNLFSQMLVGNLNLERITRLVEENQSLVIDLTSDDKKNDLAALLIDIAKQLDDDNSASDSTEIQNNNEEQQQNIVDSSVNNNTIMSQQDVALNLSKVWRILVQLLTQDQGSHTSQISECDSESCYKSVETPSGKRSVISVSQTFLTLKNLILEKNSLIKEVNKLKLLNEHLETRLGSQEKRLSTVSTELKKTWGVVSKLRVQHKQLHTQEKILKYELQHKRLLLNDLKDELERCKEIWDMARQKNCQSEEEWRKLRKEFADRRKNADINNSAESGYEDDESNTPPTEDSIDEQELDRLIDPENDSFLLMNEELSGSAKVFINDISNTGDYQDDQQNDSDTTIELLDSSQNVPLVRSTVPEEVRVDDQRNSPETVEPNSSELLEQLIEKHDVPEPETLTSNTRPTESPKSLVPSDTTAENISRFLEGLLAPDDTCQYITNITPEEQDVFCDEKSGSLEEESCSVDNVLADDSCRKENFSATENLDIHHKNCDSNDNSFPNVEICSSFSLDLVENSGIERSSLILTTQKDQTVPDPDSENSIVESKCKVDELNSEIVLDSASSPGDCCQTNEESGKFDEACGYSPTHFTEKSTSVGIPSVQEVLGRLSNGTDEPSTSLTVAAQSEKRTSHSRTTEEVLDARTERLKRLEEQCKSLFNKVTATTIKSNVLSSRLELLHEQYGRSTENFDEIAPSTTSTTNRHNDNDENYIDDKTDVKR